MKKYFNNSLFIYTTITFLFLISVLVRIESFNPSHDIKNLDASYHVLLTVKAMKETPSSVHKFLPIISLGNQLDKYIPWGATVPDSVGNYYYTSFPTLGFIAPYLYFKFTNLDTNLKNLMLFNFIIHFFSTIILCRWLSLILRNIKISERLHTTIVLFGATTYLFTFESLYSHGIIYWSQSLFQIIWLLQLLIVTSLTFFPDHKKRFKVTILILVSILLPLTEWTGYICNVVTAIYLFKKNRSLSIAVVTSTILAGLMFIGQFLLVLSPQDFYNALKMRFIARSTTIDDNKKSFLGSVYLLLKGYWESYRLLVLLPMIPIIFVIFNKIYKSKRLLILPQNFIGLLLLVSIPLSENLLLLNHAIPYTFDRLKALVLIILILSITIVNLQRFTLKIFIFCYMISVISNLWAFYHTDREMNIKNYLENNTIIQNKVFEKTDPQTVYAISSSVRGWVDLNFDRGVYENINSIGDLNHILLQRKASKGVLFLSEDLGNISYWNSAILYDNNSNLAQYITRNDILNSNESPFPLTDKNWLNGVSRLQTGFFVLETDKSKDIFKPERIVEFEDGDKRLIEKVQSNGIYLNITLRGNVLDGKRIGFPHKIKVSSS